MFNTILQVYVYCRYKTNKPIKYYNDQSINYVYISRVLSKGSGAKVDSECGGLHIARADQDPLM